MVLLGVIGVRKSEFMRKERRNGEIEVGEKGGFGSIEGQGYGKGVMQ